MDSWVWVLIGLAAGLVIAAIFGLIVRRDSSEEAEQLAKSSGALRAKDEMKSAVLQAKLDKAEAALEEQRLALEADYQKKLEASESAHRRELAALERQFTALDAAFAAQVALDSGLQPEVTVEEIDPETIEKEAASETSGVAQVLAAKAAVAEFELLASSRTADEDLYHALEQEVSREIFPSTAAAAVPTTETEEANQLIPELSETEQSDLDGDDLLQLTVSPGAGIAAPEQEYAEEIMEPEFPEEETDILMFTWSDVASDTSDQGEKSNTPYSDNDNMARTDRSQELYAARKPSIATETDDVFEDFSFQDGEIDDLPFESQTAQAHEDPAGEKDDEDQTKPADGPPAVSMTPKHAVPEELSAAEGVSSGTPLSQFEEIKPQELETAVLPADDPALDITLPVETELPDQQAPVNAVPDLVVSASPEDKSPWRGEYFGNSTLEGAPVLVREDAPLDFDWGSEPPAPEIEGDAFSVRWQKTADLPPGLYLFTVTSSDGAKLWVNDRLVISAWYDHSPMTSRREMQLPGGPLDLRLEYYAKDATAVIRLSWQRIG